MDVLIEYSQLPEYSEQAIPAINSKSLFGNYPINIACARGIIEEVLLLINAGAEINAKGEDGYTPLHDAVEQGHIKVVKLLLTRGADNSLTNNDGDTAYQLAKLLKQNEICKILDKINE